MQRRALLTTLGATVGTAAVAGSLVDAVGSDDTTTDPRPDETPTNGTTTDETTTDGTTADGTPPAGETRFVVENVEVDALPVGVDADVSVTETADATTGHPATVEVAVTNTADAPRAWRFGAVVPWSTLYGDRVDDDATVLLAPGGAENEVVPEPPQNDGCWRATDGIATIQIVNEAEFAPGETRRETYALLGGPESDCLTAATYRFEKPNYLGQIDWGFEVTLADAV